ncbi:maestro heat-like repeat-containing protein family member 2A isoform X2 [Caretta caretta]|uniref:maestro heat-like repeat-containing protein family member 2A isoform X2 n=1 Tax=Caretta caretta TaxID=8467 RepID=UPI003F4CA3EB
MRRCCKRHVANQPALGLPPWDKRQDSQHPDADIQQRGCPCSKRAASILSRGRHHRGRPSPLQNQLSGAGHRCYKQGGCRAGVLCLLGHLSPLLRDMYLKLTFIQNVMEISCAILETRDSQKFEFSYKLELLGYMLVWHMALFQGVRGRPLCLSSPVCYKAILAIGHLSKLKPSLILEENCELLDQCLKSLFPLPPLEKMMKEEVTVRRVLESPWQANEDFAGGRTNHTLVPGNVSTTRGILQFSEGVGERKGLAGHHPAADCLSRDS